VRKYLNIHELVAVGLRQKVLDPETCFTYWGEVLTNNCNDARPILDYVKNRPRNLLTHVELEELHAAWTEKKRRRTTKK
jgi:hypothetical protein